MSIKQHIERLTVQERRQLSHAFDCEVSQFIEFGDNEFVGVHLDHKRIKHLQVEENLGIWSYGRVKRN